MSAYLYLNRWDEARAVGDLATSQKKDTVSIHSFFMFMAAAKHDDVELRRHLAWAAGKPAEYALTIRFFGYQDTFGHIKESRETAQRALSLAQKFAFNEAPANVASARAFRDAFHGFSENARQTAAQALRLTDERGARSYATVALAQAGDSAQAEKIINELDKTYSADTTIKYGISPAVRALLLLHRNQATQAIAELEPVRKYDLAFVLGGTNPAFLLPYVRGLAYLQAKDGVKAVAEFQKILDHNGLNTVSVFLPLAQLGLARAYVLQGDTAKGKTAYQDFFALWKDADADTPVLLAAKSEYAKLK
jgi:tetratricopeptide (TPR) repeat protein